MDFVSDRLSHGAAQSKCLTVADDFSHECVSISLDWGISGQYVDAAARPGGCLQRGGATRWLCAPTTARSSTSRAAMAWAQTHRIRHILIEPGRPMQNGYIESCNGKFRDECLNAHWFETLQQARSKHRPLAPRL